MATALVCGSNIVADIGGFQTYYTVNQLNQATRTCISPSFDAAVSYDLMAEILPKAVQSVKDVIEVDAQNICRMASRLGWEVQGEGLACSLAFTKWLEQQSCERVTGLNLSGLKLTGVPPQLSLCVGLQKLNLSGNKLRLYPPELASLSKLKELDLSGNLLWRVPVLKGLSVLNLSNVRLTSVPDWIRDSSITTLILDHNRIAKLPSWFPEWSQGKAVSYANNEGLDEDGF